MPKIIFIVCGVYREENIGAIARAIKTMGFDALYLANPKCDHLSSKSKSIAFRSNDILENAITFNKLENAIKNIDFVIGTSAKKRNVHEDYHLAEDLPSIITAKGSSIATVGIVFGGEESGLTNQELSLCHIISTIPMRQKYPSLNLGQAVMVFATFLSKLSLNSYETKKQNSITEHEYPVIREKAKRILEDINLDTNNNIYQRIMERLSLLKKDDINLFHSFCKFYYKKHKI